MQSSKCEAPLSDTMVVLLVFFRVLKVIWLTVKTKATIKRKLKKKRRRCMTRRRMTRTGSKGGGRQGQRKKYSDGDEMSQHAARAFRWFMENADKS